MSKKSLLFILIFLVCITAQSAVPMVYPTTMEMKLNHGRGNSQFSIFNREKEKKIYKVSIRDVDNQEKKSELSKYLKVFPKYIEIEPNKTQVVRILAKGFPTKDVKDGEYRASIAIEEIESGLRKKYKKKVQAKEVTTEINFKFVINMALYGYVGTLTPSINIDKISKLNGIFSATISNTGNYSYPIKYCLLDSNGKILEEKNISKLMWNEKKKIKIKIVKGTSLLRIIESKKKMVLYEKNMLL